MQVIWSHTIDLCEEQTHRIEAGSFTCKYVETKMHLTRVEVMKV